MRLSVLILAPPGTDPGPTLQALDAQELPVWERRIVTATRAIDTLLTQHPGLSGTWLGVLRAGDLPAPDWALRALETAQAQGASCVITPARHQSGTAPLDMGILPLPEHPAAPDPAMLVLHRPALATLPDALRHLPDPVAALCLAALLPSTGTGTDPALTLAPRKQEPLTALARSLARTPLCPLPASTRASLFAHLAQTRMACTPSKAHRLAIALRAGIARRRARLPAPLCGPEIGPILRLCLGGKRP